MQNGQTAKSSVDTLYRLQSVVRVSYLIIPSKMEQMKSLSLLWGIISVSKRETRNPAFDLLCSIR